MLSLHGVRTVRTMKIGCIAAGWAPAADTEPVLQGACKNPVEGAEAGSQPDSRRREYEETRPSDGMPDIYLRKNAQRSLTIMPYIYIVPIAAPAAHWLAPLERALAACFSLPVRRMHCAIDLEQTFDPGRGQYNSSQILLQLIRKAPPDTAKILGVAAVDLFVPILTYVFGEAQLGGIGALVSTHRLNSRLYGLPDNEPLLHERLIKESIHELGHTFGLLHCTTPGCALNASTYVEDIDQKSDRICDACRACIRDYRSA